MSSIPFNIDYIKNTLELPNQKTEITLGKTENDPTRIENTQLYNPIYSLFFQMNDGNYNKICMNHKYHFVDMENVYDYSSKTIHSKHVFLKFAPLLDPIRYLTGKYNSFPKEDLTKLPDIRGEPSSGFKKLYDPNNSSYVDNFFCYLSSQLLHHHGFFNGLDYYGSFLGIQNKYKINVIDDLDFLMQHEYFRKQKNVLYEIEDMYDPFSNFGSRGNKKKLLINDETVLLENVIEIKEDVFGLSNETHPPCEDEIHIEKEMNEILNLQEENHNETIRLLNKEEDSDSECNSEIDYSDNEKEEKNKSETESDRESESESDHESEEDDDENTCSDESTTETHLAYIYKFPIQMICLEKCQGTLDDLFIINEMDAQIGNAMLMQIIMSLLTYQKTFHFTHNDLHTNNIMWNTTKEEYLYYKFNSVVYKVPSYGKIYKLIDFGRAIYKFKDHVYCSDSFAPEGDASTQYNFGCYYNPNKKMVEPNYSFDLCRLATSIYDFILDKKDQLKDTETNGDSFQNIIHKLVMDDNAHNILYKRNGDDRYPGFKLYKLIARSVHGAHPEEQLNNKIFQSYIWKKKVPSKSFYFDLDALPNYTFSSTHSPPL